MTMHCTATFRPPDDTAFATVARAWFTTARDHLFPELWQEIDTGDPRFAVTMGTRRNWEAKPEVTTYRRTRWRELVDTLTARPVAVTLLARAAGTASGPDIVRITLEPAAGNGKVVRLQVDAAQEPGQPADLAHCRRWVDFLTTALADADPDFGLVTGDAATLATSVELALGRAPLRGIQDSRDILRGCSWVTVCPAELSETLGGAKNLAEGGAFVRVEPLAGGGTLLQATATLAQFDDTALARVFHALAPVLPQGMPHPPAGDGNGNGNGRTVHNDAGRNHVP